MKQISDRSSCVALFWRRYGEMFQCTDAGEYRMQDFLDRFSSNVEGKEFRIRPVG